MQEARKLSIAQVAGFGLVAGLWFAAVEACFVAAEQLGLPAGVARSTRPLVEATVVLCYAAVGALVGFAIGLILARSSSADAGGAHAAVGLALLLAIELPLWRVPVDLQTLFTHGTIGLLAILAGLGLARRLPKAGLPLLHPLCISLLVLAVPIARLVFPDAEGRELIPPAALWIAAILLLSTALARWKLPGGITASALGLGLGFAILGTPALEPSILPQSGSTSDPRPNVVLITLDTVRADHLSVYGYEHDTTPNLARLAPSSLVFERAYSASDLTLPSHASLFSGLPPRSHGAHADAAGRPWGHGLPDRIDTLAEQFSARGYATYAVAANAAVINPRTGLAQGFRHFDARLGPAPGGGAGRWLPRYHVGKFLEWLGLQREPYRSAGAIRHSAERVLDAASQAQPFFLFLNWMDAHFPYSPPEPEASLFPGRDPASTLHDNKADYLALRNEILSGRAELAPNDRAHLVSQYDGGIHYVDRELARLLDRMESMGILQDTLLFITADHGEAFGEHRSMSHGVSVYDEQTRVPAILRGPGLTPARRGGSVSVDAIAALLPALAEAAEPERDALVANTSRAVVVTESYPETWVMELVPGNTTPTRAILSENQKWVETEGQPGRFFDLAVDPGERSPRAAAADPRATALVAELDDWLRAHPEGAGKPVTLDPTTANALEALGYFIPGSDND